MTFTQFQTLTAKLNASRRTKNRIKENGPKFELRGVSHPSCMNGRRSMLLSSPSTNWFGWLLCEEIKEDE